MKPTPPRSSIDISPLVRAARRGGPLARALGVARLHAFVSTTHDDRLLGEYRARFSIEPDLCADVSSLSAR